MESRLRSGWIALTLHLFASALSAQPAEGTYSFVVFGEATVDTVAVGQFAVTRNGFDLADWPDPFRERVLRNSRWLLFEGAATPTACFGFSSSQRVVGDREFYPGIISYGLSLATFVADTMKIPVYQSIDANAQLAAWVGAGDFSGVIHQRDYNQWEAGTPVEWLSFEARRLGEADEASCREALELGLSGR